MSSFGISTEGMESIIAKVEAFPSVFGQCVGNVLHGEGGEVIASKITELIHPSGRTFKGHTSSATSTKWYLKYTSESFAVTIRSKSKFNYLYFPDDGSNTKRHAGGQDFTGRGMQAAIPKIEELLINAVDESWK
ncbi:MAG: hypothetical protein ACI4BI_01820 [Anaerotardibacter sp.]